MRIVAINWTKSLSKCLVRRAIVEQSSNCHRVPNCRNFQHISAQFAKNAEKQSDKFVGIGARSFGTTPALSKAKDKGEKKKAKGQRVNETELAQFIDFEHLTSNFDKSLEDLKGNFVKHLTLRSSAGSIEQVNVTFDGQEYLLQELVDVARKPKVVVLDVATFPQAIPQILDALNKSGLNLNPQQDGTTIFIPIPKITKDHRENLAKNAKGLYIRCRDGMKDIRNKEIKNLKKKDSLSDDECRRVQVQIEAVCDRYIKDAEKLLDTKQKELLGSSD